MGQTSSQRKAEADEMGQTSSQRKKRRIIMSRGKGEKIGEGGR